MIPILICGEGRTGTTALMKLMSACHGSFCDSVYTYERRYLTYGAKLAQLLNRDIGYREFTIEDLATLKSPVWAVFRGITTIATRAGAGRDRRKIGWPFFAGLHYPGAEK